MNRMSKGGRSRNGVADRFRYVTNGRERHETCCAIHRHTKTNNTYMKDYATNPKIVISHVLRCKKCYTQAMPRKLIVDSFERRNDKLRFDRKFIQNMMKTVTKDRYSKSMLSKYPSSVMIYARCRVIFRYYLKE